MNARTGLEVLGVLALFVGGAYLILGREPGPAGSAGASPTSSADPGHASAAIQLRAPAVQESDMPRFTRDGSLIRPEGWEAWVMVGTSIGLTYTESSDEFARGEGPGMFLNVYMQPWAYRQFRETGEFAEGTIFILAGSQPSRKADPARGGFYEGDRALMEVHLKKEGLHESGWGFYGFGGDAESAQMIPGTAACYSCHAENTALDNVFVQFYPALRDMLPERGAE